MGWGLIMQHEEEPQWIRRPRLIFASSSCSTIASLRRSTPRTRVAVRLRAGGAVRADVPLRVRSDGVMKSKEGGRVQGRPPSFFSLQKKGPPMLATNSSTATVDAALKRGAVEDVTDEGQVLLRLP